MGRKLHSHLSFLLPGVEEKVMASHGVNKRSQTEDPKRGNSLGDKVLVKNIAAGPRSLSDVIPWRRGPVAV